jgi:lipopolysaccharide/colanic/teichoic acid biosynthesis glycosyltransferase
MTAALLTVLLGLLAYEAKAWFPRAVEALISVAVRRLPKRQRDRFREEWRAHINDTPGAVLRLWQAFGFIIASGRMFPRWTSALAQRRAYLRGVLLTRIATRALDLLIVGPALLLLAPLLLVISLLLRADGPPLFRQLRFGRGRRVFYIYKFRTMRLASPDEPGRVTPIGRVLRATSLDELPQLINVLRGDMSLVGPRPSGLTIQDEHGAVLNLRPEDILIKVRRGAWDEKPGMTGPIALDGESAGPQPHQVGHTVRRYFRTLALTLKRALHEADRL